MSHETDTSGNELPQDEQISQAYQSLDKETTPPALDEHILTAARREASSRPQHVSFTPRWAIPVSVAAVIVLSVSLFTMHRTPLTVTPAPTTTAIPAEPLMEEQETRPEAVEKKQEPLLKQRSVAKPMKSDMPEADIQTDQDSAVSGIKMFEAKPVLEKEEAMAPAPATKVSADTTVIEEQLATIRQLLKEGKQEEALAALKAFQEHHPEYPLADDLKAILEK